jgi:hypothetical protein
MITRSEAIRRILEGFEEWAQIDAQHVRFVLDERLEHRDTEVVTAAEHVVRLDREEEWSDLLDPARTWLNATLHFDTSHQPVVSLRSGPRRPDEEVDPAVDVPIVVSVEPKPLRLQK